jgi:hypothetical protein
MNKKTYDELPSILNSISYHLKRIADELEAKNNTNTVDSGKINIDIDKTKFNNLIKKLKS